LYFFSSSFICPFLSSIEAGTAAGAEARAFWLLKPALRARIFREAGAGASALIDLVAWDSVHAGAARDAVGYAEVVVRATPRARAPGQAGARFNLLDGVEEIVERVHPVIIEHDRPELQGFLELVVPEVDEQLAALEVFPRVVLEVALDLARLRLQVERQGVPDDLGSKKGQIPLHGSGIATTALLSFSPRSRDGTGLKAFRSRDALLRAGTLLRLDALDGSAQATFLDERNAIVTHPEQNERHEEKQADSLE